MMTKKIGIAIIALFSLGLTWTVVSFTLFSGKLSQVGVIVFFVSLVTMLIWVLAARMILWWRSRTLPKKRMDVFVRLSLAVFAVSLLFLLCSTLSAKLALSAFPLSPVASPTTHLLLLLSIAFMVHGMFRAKTAGNTRALGFGGTLTFFAIAFFPFLYGLTALIVLLLAVVQKCWRWDLG